MRGSRKEKTRKTRLRAEDFRENYIDNGTSLFRRHWFLFFDSADCMAASLFNRLQIRPKVKFVWTRGDCRYNMILCRVAKREADLFRKAMNDLVTKMAIIGDREYESFCRDAIRELREGLAPES